ncbi:MAG: pyridoxal phosphate-dependent aminotransferase [Caulobacteraceae bacterium]|nr:pyridoxal phosphate-dependent aminotransferase [Caulobacteraceae bacterium]
MAEHLSMPMGRRMFLGGVAFAAAAPIVTEAQLAWAAVATDAIPKGRALHGQGPDAPPPGAVLINANENPLGPSKGACEAITRMAPLGGRYDLLGESQALTKVFADQHGLRPENIAIYAGSSEPLQYAVLAFTSPQRGLVVADPSYEAPVAAAETTKARVAKVALAADYAHDVKAMVAADPTAGVIYICNPNNPTGTLTSREAIVWALDNKPQGSVLLVDEAYIHFADAPDVLDLVAAGKDLIVLRTFSKVYGMAGLRCGFAVARPDLLARLEAFGGHNSMSVTSMAAARVSLLDSELVPVRKKIIGDTRRQTITWLNAAGYKVIGDPQTNCFMIDTQRNGRGVIAAMKAKNVYIGRAWPVWPNAVRISVGTPEEMGKFRTAFKEVMDAPALASAG